jgi:membrane protein
MLRFLRLFRLSCWRAFEHDAFGTAKASAYSLILSLFPALMLTASILISFEETHDFANDLAESAARFLPPGTGGTIRAYFEITKAKPVPTLILASLITLWAASGVIITWMEYFRRAYKMPKVWGIIKERLIAFGLVIMAGVPLSFATILVAFGNEIEQRFAERMMFELGHMVEPYILLMWSIIRWIIAIVTCMAVMALIYHHAVPRTQRWHSVLAGSALASGLWFSATIGFGWYVRHFAQYSLYYGSLAAAIVLLVWLWIISFIVMVGAEFNALLYPRVLAPPAPAPIAVVPVRNAKSH